MGEICGVQLSCGQLYVLEINSFSLSSIQMDENNSDSSKDMGDHVMTDPSEAGTPHGDVTILGPSSQPGTPCSDLMVPTASHTPLPPSHTPGPVGHAPGPTGHASGVPMGHLSHGGVLTTGHSAGKLYC